MALASLSKRTWPISAASYGGVEILSAADVGYRIDIEPLSISIPSIRGPVPGGPLPVCDFTRGGGRHLH